MKLSALQNLMAVVERGSIRAAARSLDVPQPVITRSIQELERELKVILFERGKKGVTLTPMGQVFWRRAVMATGELRRAQDELDQLRGETHGHIRMCLSTVAHMALLPNVLGPFSQRFPNVTLEIIDAVLPRVDKELKDGTLDLYIGPTYERLSGELSAEKLFDNQRVVLCRKGHPLAGATSLAELEGARWITTSIAYEAEDELSPIFLRNGLPAPTLAMQAHSALTFYLTIANSDLLSMLPVQWTQVQPFRNTLHRIAVTEPLYAPAICIVQRTGLPLTPAAEYFCDMVRRASLHRDSLITG